MNTPDGADAETVGQGATGQDMMEPEVTGPEATGPEATMGAGTAQEGAKRTWVEEIEVAGHQLIERLEALLQDRTKRVYIKTQEGKEILRLPLMIGVVAGGILTLAAPLLAAIAAIAALAGKVKLEVVREEDPVEREEGNAAEEVEDGA